MAKLISEKSKGGAYIPPFKLRKMMEEKMANAKEESEEYQQYMWDNLKKSINGIINKVNTQNIANVVVELFNENLIRGRGLLAKAILKAQNVSQAFSHVFASLVAVVNTKLPDVVSLLLHRLIL